MFSAPFSLYNYLEVQDDKSMSVIIIFHIFLFKNQIGQVNFFIWITQCGLTDLKFRIWSKSTQWLLSFDAIPVETKRRDDETENKKYY